MLFYIWVLLFPQKTISEMFENIQGEQVTLVKMSKKA